MRGGGISDYRFLWSVILLSAWCTARAAATWCCSRPIGLRRVRHRFGNFGGISEAEFMSEAAPHGGEARRCVPARPAPGCLSRGQPGWTAAGPGVAEGAECKWITTHIKLEKNYMCPPFGFYPRELDHLLVHGVSLQYEYCILQYLHWSQPSLK